jgi:ATP-dependent exoDNAse (exonuclease V) beta subunit
MEPASAPTDFLTPSQRQAVVARGNVPVMAGAGTGKTKTLAARCLDCLDRGRASLDELLDQSGLDLAPLRSGGAKKCL